MTLDLAIVVPVGPDDESWRVLLPQLVQLDVREIVLVFADDAAAESARCEEPSSDNDATSAPVRFIAGPRGRARQLNAGAEAAQAHWLWFLHADSILTPGCAAALARHIKR
ncbi:MAG: glycosyltransferase, partial [Dokdonella sp.]